MWLWQQLRTHPQICDIPARPPACAHAHPTPLLALPLPPLPAVAQVDLRHPARVPASLLEVVHGTLLMEVHSISAPRDRSGTAAASAAACVLACLLVHESRYYCMRKRVVHLASLPVVAADRPTQIGASFPSLGRRPKPIDLSSRSIRRTLMVSRFEARRRSITARARAPTPAPHTCLPELTAPDRRPRCARAAACIHLYMMLDDAICVTHDLSIVMAYMLPCPLPVPPRRPWLLAVGAGDDKLRVYDRRMLVLAGRSASHAHYRCRCILRTSPEEWDPHFAAECISGVAFAADGKTVYANYMGGAGRGAGRGGRGRGGEGEGWGGEALVTARCQAPCRRLTHVL